MTKFSKPMPRLPSGIAFSESDDGGTFRMAMDRACATANMQEDRAAFEAWALCAKAAGYGRVELSEVGPPDGAGGPQGLHYNRFLYRALRFCEGFSWFALSPALGEKTKRFADGELSREDLRVNAPAGEEALEANTPEGRKARELVRPGPLDVLLGGGESTSKYHLYLPVGLFGGEVAEGRQIFPSHCAAIDIWGISGKTFHLVELKVKSNKGLGVLSEAFFYACFARDMFCRLHLERGVSGDPIDKNWRGYRELVGANIESVAAHILTEGKHTRLDAAFAELQRCALEGIRFGGIGTL